MEKISELLGFEARFILYPLTALLIAGSVKFVIHRYLRIWTEKTSSKVDDHIVGYIESLVTPLLLFSLLYFVVAWLPLTAEKIFYIRKGLLIAVILLVCLYSARLTSVILTLMRTQREGLQRFMQPLRMLSNVVFALVGIALSLKALEVNLSDEGIRLVRIIGIVVGAYVLLKIINLAVVHMEHMVGDENAINVSEAEKRAKTLGKIINSVGLVLVVGISIMMILSEFGINIAPIITGAGIAGLAVGFGAQNLVRDIISGFFLILEDQIRVGDVVKLNGTGGSVEAIRLRTTILRDAEGTVHIFPNGEIKQVANMTKGYSYSVLDIGVAYKENVDEVMDLLKSLGDELARDPAFRPSILEPVEILGIEGFGDSQVTIRIRMKTLPLKQWMVGRELRRRIKNTFDTRGIEIPFPQINVHFGQSGKAFELMQAAPQKTGQKTDIHK